MKTAEQMKSGPV